MNSLVLELVIAVIGIIGALITYLLVPYIRAKTSVTQLEKAQEWVRIAVTAAEQLYIASGSGALKKEHVIKFLEGHGIILNEEQLDVIIEAAVYELNRARASI